MPRLGLKFLDGPAQQERPVKYTLDELPDTWYLVIHSGGTKRTAVYERVDVNGDGQGATTGTLTPWTRCGAISTRP
jgi:hypothetical protein